MPLNAYRANSSSNENPEVRYVWNMCALLLLIISIPNKRVILLQWKTHAVDIITYLPLTKAMVVFLPEISKINFVVRV